MTNMELMLSTVDQILPIIITLAAIVIAVCLMVGYPYCHYVTLISGADTDKGKEDLAKYLAKKAGGRKINNNQSWKAFIPAARALHKKHLVRKNSK